MSKLTSLGAEAVDLNVSLSGPLRDSGAKLPGSLVASWLHGG
jgi:hypothetical protein